MRFNPASRIPYLYEGTVPFEYRGEKDAASMITADMLSLIYEKYPRKLTPTNSTIPVAQMLIDFVEDESFAAVHSQNMRDLTGLRSLAEPLGNTASCYFAGKDYWIVVHAGLVRAAHQIVHELATSSNWRERMGYQFLSPDQILIAESLACRLAVECYIVHEEGHIRHGHKNPKLHEIYPSTDRNRRLCETAADQYAAQAIALRCINSTFIASNVAPPFDSLGIPAVVGWAGVASAIYLALTAASGKQAIGHPEHELRSYMFFHNVLLFVLNCRETVRGANVADCHPFVRRNLPMFFAFTTYELSEFFSSASSDSYGIRWLQDAELRRSLQSEASELETELEHAIKIWEPYSFWGKNWTEVVPDELWVP